MTMDAVSEAVDREIEAAKEAILKVIGAEPKRRWWSAYELKTRARNGWSSGAMGLALDELVKEGTLVVDDASLEVGAGS